MELETARDCWKSSFVHPNGLLDVFWVEWRRCCWVTSMPCALHVIALYWFRRVQWRLVDSFWRESTPTPYVLAVAVFMVTMGFTWPPRVLNERQTDIVGICGQILHGVKIAPLQFFFLSLLCICTLKEYKILTPKHSFNQACECRNFNDSCSYVLRNFDIKCINSFWDTRCTLFLKQLLSLPLKLLSIGLS